MTDELKLTLVACLAIGVALYRWIMATDSAGYTRDDDLAENEETFSPPDAGDFDERS